MPEETMLRYGEAINEALRRALREWPETLVYGEDVAKPGGVFGVTRRLRREYGARVFDTPISESAILGSAVGAAMMGRRPIVEIMWADFSLVALDQLINQAANVRYVSRGELSAPITVRTQQGFAPGSCAQHSQCLEAVFCHMPGLRVCIPATAQDAYDLTLAAIACNDPTIVIECRRLYAGARQAVRLGEPVQPIGGHRLRRSGDDITIVSWGAVIHDVLAAAEELRAEHGIGAEVIEAVWLAPFDHDAVIRSASRTGRLAVVHEANVSAGFGAEVLARTVEAGIRLRVPPQRLGLPGVRVPAAPVLAEAVLPCAAAICDLVLGMAGRPGRAVAVPEADVAGKPRMRQSVPRKEVQL
jgi:acetoin:2,6-dichlorophenolindophenol oxidoreductase subunit beta